MHHALHTNPLNIEEHDEKPIRERLKVYGEVLLQLCVRKSIKAR